MFIVCESIAWGMEHVPFNAALLRTIRLAFPNDIIYFYAEEYHLKHVREQIGEEISGSIIWRKLVLPPRNASFYGRLSNDFKNVKFLLDELDENSCDGVLVITGNASILWALKHYTGTKHKDKRVQVIIHGDFTTLQRTPRKSILNPFYYVGSLKTALRISGYDRIQHIVLEEAVRDIIIKRMPFLRESVSVLDHPIPVDGQHVILKDLVPPFQFGFLGRASEKKGFSKFLNVASEISKQFYGKAEFHLIGRISNKQRRANHSKMTLLREKPTTERLRRNEYVDRLQRIHYVCLFYDKHYEFSASGVLMDSIAWKKPIIATQLPILKALEQRFGDIGYLCGINEISETVSSIIQTNDSDRYKRQVLNVSKVKASRTPEALAMKYVNLVNSL